jgi:hypothetical protein
MQKRKVIINKNDCGEKRMTGKFIVGVSWVHEKKNRRNQKQLVLK